MSPCRRFLVVAACALALGSPLVQAAQDPVKGSGVAATQRRDVGAFTTIALGAHFSVVVRPGTRESVEVVADDNLLPLIETIVTGANDRSLTLRVAHEARIEPRTPIVVTVEVVDLRALAVGGSGSIDATGLRLDRLSASIGGSGDIRLPSLEVGKLDVSIGGSGRLAADGRAGRLSVTVAGSGRCDLERLVAGDVSVAVVGSGSAAVHAQTSLHATIAGNGDVLYRGDVRPSASIVGNGRLRRL